jgi:DNA polymerase-1
MPRTRLVLQIHDELVYETPTEDVARVCRIIKESMENTVTLRVPLIVRLKCGTRWGTLEEDE